jgi:hypothetical protein
MITLPPGFNYTALVNDLLSASLPFIIIGMLIIAYVIVSQALRKL